MVRTMSGRGTLRVGTRGSLLALAQTGSVVDAIRGKFPGMTVETVRIKTTGDKIVDSPLFRIGVKSLFTKEIEEAILDKKVDLAVHSLKDLPTEVPPGLAIGAVLEREDPRDCLISSGGWTLRTLPQKARVGTSSLRRQAQILALRPDLQVENLRGNLDTRMRKLEDGVCEAIVLAVCGVGRLNSTFESRGGKFFLNVIPYEEMLPAVGQGSLAIEVRQDDEEVLSIVRDFEHGPSRTAASCERSFLKTLQGGCQIPVGVRSEVRGKNLSVEGLIASLRGEKIVRDNVSGSADSAEALGEDLAIRLLRSGGDRILESIRH